MDDFGPLIWETPTTAPAPKPVVYIVAGSLITLAVLLSLAVAPMAINSINDERDRAGAVAGCIIALSLLASGCWLIHRRRTKTRDLGTMFFQSGVEFGPQTDRERISYAEFEDIWIEPVPPPTILEKIHFVLGGDIDRLSHALGLSKREEVAGILWMTPFNGFTISEAILDSHFSLIQEAIQKSFPEPQRIICYPKVPVIRVVEIDEVTGNWKVEKVMTEEAVHGKRAG